MTDMTAFERRVADGMLHRAGPIHPVDDLGIYEAVMAANRQRRWGFTMFSALKFVAAALVVALAGGFMLASFAPDEGDVSTAPAASATATPSPSAGQRPVLVSEDVAPGVRRVVNDGVRELRWVVPPADDGDEAFVLGALGNIAVGPSEAVWVVWDDELIKLGDATVHEWHTDALANVFYRLEVASDGRLWLAYGDLVSYGPDGPTVHVESPRYGTFWDLEVLPGDDVWALRRFGDRAIGRYGRDGWNELPQAAPDDAFGLEVSDAGDLWLLVSEQLGDETRRVVYRYADADGWQPLELPAADAEELHDIAGARLERLSVTPDGMLWISLYDDDRTCEPDWCAIGPDALARFGGGGWEVFSPTTGMPPLGPSSYQTGRYLEASPDGSVWVQPAGDPTANGTDCAGVANFDGRSWTSYLEDLCIYAMDVAPDGSVWTLAGPRTAWGPEPRLPNEWDRFEGAPTGPVELYVIDPEAAATSG